MDVTARLAATSTAYLHVPARARRAGTPVTPTGVKIAILAGVNNPATADWHDATYADGTARLLIGPEGGDLTLEPGDYYVWARWAAGAETPVALAPGRLRIY